VRFRHTVERCPLRWAILYGYEVCGGAGGEGAVLQVWAWDRVLQGGVVLRASTRHGMRLKGCERSVGVVRMIPWCSVWRTTTWKAWISGHPLSLPVTTCVFTLSGPFVDDRHTAANARVSSGWGTYLIQPCAPWFQARPTQNEPDLFFPKAFLVARKREHRARSWLLAACWALQRSRSRPFHTVQHEPWAIW
jgi:hypothetical protein